MGWLKSIFKPIVKTVGKAASSGALGPLWEKLEDSVVDYARDGQTPEVSATTSSAVDTAPAISQEEAEGLSAKRLARLGRYFTSPLGVLNNASTGSQKVFS